MKLLFTIYCFFTCSTLLASDYLLIFFVKAGDKIHLKETGNKPGSVHKINDSIYCIKTVSLTNNYQLVFNDSVSFPLPKTAMNNLFFDCGNCNFLKIDLRNVEMTHSCLNVNYWFTYTNGFIEPDRVIDYCQGENALYIDVRVIHCISKELVKNIPSKYLSNIRKCK
jgi:hypothetical protein